MIKNISFAIFIYISLTSVCFSNDVTYICDDVPEGGLGEEWNVTGALGTDSEKFICGNESLKSHLRGTQSTNISTIVRGPCEVSFWWSISEGSNELILYDDNDPTIYRLPNYFQTSARHEAKDWAEITYNIKDVSRHELKWSHTNPYGIGSAWIDGIRISEPDIVFREPQVTPWEGLGISRNVDPNWIKGPQNFTYRVDVETKSPSLKLNLVTIHPDCNKNFFLNRENSSKFDPVTKKYIKTFQWNNVTLNCKSFGMGQYWFETDCGVKSKSYPGPNISTFIIDVTKEIIDIVPGESYNITYCLQLIGKPRIINFQGKHLDEEDWSIIAKAEKTTNGLYCCNCTWYDDNDYAVRFRVY